MEPMACRKLPGTIQVDFHWAALQDNTWDVVMLATPNFGAAAITPSAPVYGNHGARLHAQRHDPCGGGGVANTIAVGSTVSVLVDTGR